MPAAEQGPALSGRSADSRGDHPGDARSRPRTVRRPNAWAVRLSLSWLLLAQPARQQVTERRRWCICILALRGSPRRVRRGDHAAAELMGSAAPRCRSGFWGEADRAVLFEGQSVPLTRIRRTVSNPGTTVETSPSRLDPAPPRRPAFALERASFAPTPPSFARGRNVYAKAKSGQEPAPAYAYQRSCRSSSRPIPASRRIPASVPRLSSR
jgi:hypothetical protein